MNPHGAGPVSLQLNGNAKSPVFVFDLGGVLIKWHNNDQIYRYIARRYHVPFATMERALIGGLPKVESGEVPTEDFVRDGLLKVGRSLRAGDSGEELWLRPFAQSAKVRLGVARLVAALRKQGYPVYALSNISPQHLAFASTRGWTKLFDGFFASCELGCVKPQAEIFEKVLDAIGASPDQVTFIDDNPICIRGAKEFGIRRAIRYQSIPQLKKGVDEVIFAYKRTKPIP
jgi:FMN phosphatase YigB (HAD superfamily)